MRQRLMLVAGAFDCDERPAQFHDEMSRASHCGFAVDCLVYASRPQAAANDYLSRPGHGNYISRWRQEPDEAAIKSVRRSCQYA
jgi:hypothetical protein